MSDLEDGRPHTVGTRIARARRECGFTQRELADVLGVPAWTVDRFERGAADATRHLSMIADVTQRRPEWFLRGVENASTGSLADVTWTQAGKNARNLVLGSIVLLVTIRFFTEVVPIVPRAANFIDVPIFLVLVVAAMTVARPTHGRRTAYLELGLPALLFLGLAVVSALINVSRIAPAPVLVFLFGFLGPTAVFASVYRLWTPGHARALSRLLVALGLIQLAVVALIDLPRFFASGNNPDLISGTFGTNPYQLVFFLLVVAPLLGGIFAVEHQRTVARFVPALLLLIFGTILLAQYRALLATTVITIAVVAFILGRRARGFVVSSVAVVAFVVAFSYISSSFPILRLHGTATTLTENPASYLRERAKVSGIIERLYSDDPFASLRGTGPGTFSSRAWQTFALAGSTSASNVQGGYATALTGGTYETDVSLRYIRPQLRQGPVIEGSRAVSSPFSSYLSLLAEVGVFGLVLIAGVYAAALGRAARVTLVALRYPSPGDSLPALALATTIAFLTLVQLAFLENWLEVTRVTFISWIMLAVVLKEFDARLVGGE